VQREVCDTSVTSLEVSFLYDGLMGRRRLCVVVLVLGVAVTAAPAAPAGGRLTSAERRGINRTLDAFVPAAVRRDDPEAALALAAPALRVGTSRQDWRRGNIPVYPYPAQGKRFHYWTFSYRDGREVGVELQLHSRYPRRVGPITFKVSLVPRGGRWLVSSFMPAAVFAPVGAPPKVRSVRDFSAGSMTDPVRSRPKLDKIWILAPLFLLGLSVFIAIGFPLVKWQLDRRSLRKI
jgi:hypothetical protein